jgi:fermentation-respiration switch protein FrsA (DUF1100 family)
VIPEVSQVAAEDLTNEPQSAAPRRDSASATGKSLDELLLFHPAKYPAGDWNPPPLEFEEAWFTSVDGTELHGWYCAAESPRGSVLLAHGNGGNITSRASWIYYLQRQLHLNVLAFDYRGYGRSSGKPDVKGCLEDTRAARAELCRLAAIGDHQVILMGESLGGAMVCQLAAESEPRALILQSTFGSMRDVADYHFSALAWLVPRSKLDSATALSNYTGPLLQSHGDADTVVPFESGQRLFESAAGPKQFVHLQGIDHNNWPTDQYLVALSAFLERLP